MKRPSNALRHDDGHNRCPWAACDPIYVAYHDDEWGVPEYDDRALFEKLILDGFQAGLESVEDQFLEQRTVIVFRHAPLVVVIGDVDRIAGRPRATIVAVIMAQGVARPLHFASPGNGNLPHAGLTGRIAMPPAGRGVPAAIASSTRAGCKGRRGGGPSLRPLRLRPGRDAATPVRVLGQLIPVPRPASRPP